MALNVRPVDTIDSAVKRACRDAIASSKINSGSKFHFVQSTYLNYVGGSEYRLRMAFPLRSMGSAMPGRIGAVFFARSPTKIEGAIIDAISIVMSDFVFWRWRVAVKSRANQNMDSHRLGAASKADLEPFKPFIERLAKDLAFIRPWSPGGHNRSVDRANSADVRNFISRMFGDWFPNFWYRDVNHCALLKHGGQRFEAGCNPSQVSFYTISGRVVSFPS